MLRVFENMVLRRIFGPKMDEVISGDKIEQNEMGGACGTYGGEERRIQGFGGET